MTEAQASLEIPENVSFALKILLPEQRQQVYDFVEFLLQKQQIANSQQQQQTDLVGLRQITTERILGLHQGRGSISDDFAKPLPERKMCRFSVMMGCSIYTQSSGSGNAPS